MKLNTLLIILIIVSCGNSEDNRSNLRTTKWLIETEEGNSLYKVINWEDYSSKIKSLEIEYDGKYETYRYFKNGLNSRTEVIMDQKDTFSITIMDYDEYDNLRVLKSIMHGDTSIVTYDNTIEMSSKKLIKSIISSENEVKGKVILSYTDSTKQVTSYMADSLWKVEKYLFDRKERMVEYVCNYQGLTNSTKTQYGKWGKISTEHYMNGHLSEKWNYSYDENGNLTKASKWTPDLEENYTIEHD